MVPKMVGMSEALQELGVIPNNTKKYNMQVFRTASFYLEFTYDKNRLMSPMKQ